MSVRANAFVSSTITAFLLINLIFTVRVFARGDVAPWLGALLIVGVLLTARAAFRSWGITARAYVRSLNDEG